MHDGRFATLEQVVEHYNSGIQNHPTLSNALKTPQGNPVRLNFNTAQKAAMVAFLKTFTDNTVATEARWSNPFVPCVGDVNLSGTITSGTYQASSKINLQNGLNQSGSNVNVGASNAITLSPPFEVKSVNYFKAQIGGCN